MDSSAWKGEGCTCLEPENIMCSKRWANPLCPGVWLAAPTWYQTSTATCGSRWSSLRITVSPLGSWYFSNLMSGSAARAANVTASTETAARLRMDDLRRACLLRHPLRGKARVGVGGILRHLVPQPRGAIEALTFTLQLYFGQPEIAAAEVVEIEPPHAAAHLAQRARAHAQQRLGVLRGDGVVEFGAGEQALALDGQLGMPRPVRSHHQPHPHRGLGTQVPLLQVVPIRQLGGQPLLLHQELPLDLDRHGSFFRPDYSNGLSQVRASSSSWEMTMWPMGYSCQETARPRRVSWSRRERPSEMGSNGSSVPWAAKTGKPFSPSGAERSCGSSARTTPESESTPATRSGRFSATPSAMPAPWLKPSRMGRGEPRAISSTAASADATASRTSPASKESPRASWTRLNQARIGPPSARGPCSDTARSRGSSAGAMERRSGLSAPVRGKRTIVRDSPGARGGSSMALSFTEPFYPRAACCC